MAIRLLIVDDSAVVRQTLEKELGLDPDIQIVGTAPDPFIARDKIIELKPQVMTLDIEMPRMDGLTFLKKLMKHHPLPIIIVSSIAARGSQVALEAMHSGAVDVMCKPGSAFSLGDLSIELAEKVKAAARIDMNRLLQSLRAQGSAVHAVSAPLTKLPSKIVVLGASTGGVQAIEAVARRLPKNAPGTVVVQHMPAGFTRAFAERLDKLCEIEVREAKDGDEIRPGLMLICPGGLHMMVKSRGAGYAVEVKDGPLVNKHKPSVEVLFLSAAQTLGAKAIGVMLTGMGADGARGMLKMREAGSLNVGQDEKSCVVYGMPRAAAEIGAVEHVLPLDQIADFVLKASQ